MKPLIAVLTLSLAACGKKADVAHMPREQVIGIAREAAQDAFQQLSGELAKAIENGGPVAAIPVCSTKAESLVAEVAAKRKLTMIRLSDRPRNPTQAATGPDLAAIESFRTRCGALRVDFRIATTDRTPSEFLNELLADRKRLGA
jgi:hypothetical protein